jgi:hypothetical protein
VASEKTSSRQKSKIIALTLNQRVNIKSRLEKYEYSISNVVCASNIDKSQLLGYRGETCG